MAQPVNAKPEASQVVQSVQSVSAAPVKLERVQLSEAVAFTGQESLRVLTHQHGDLTVDFATRTVRAVPKELQGRPPKPTLVIPFEAISHMVIWDPVRIERIEAANRPAPAPAPAPAKKVDDTVKL